MTTPQHTPRSTSVPPPIPMPCAECASPGMPYMIDTVPNSKQILVAVRCLTCRHEWALQLTVDTL